MAVDDRRHGAAEGLSARRGMSAGARNRPPLFPCEAWISEGRQVLHVRARRHNRWSQNLGVTFGDVVPGDEPPLLRKRRELTWEQPIKLWAEKRQQGWKP